MEKTPDCPLSRQEPLPARFAIGAERRDETDSCDQHSRRLGHWTLLLPVARPADGPDGSASEDHDQADLEPVAAADADV